MGGMQDEEWHASKVPVRNWDILGHGQIYEGLLWVFIFHFLRRRFMQPFKVKRSYKSAGCYLPAATQPH